MFADYELQAHRLVEEGKPVTADVLSEIYFGLLQAYHGDAIDYDPQSRVTWARIPHFYSTPYYVYQYATCFASSAELLKQIMSADAASRPAAVRRYLTLLESGGSDHPMTLLLKAGIDLSRPEPVQAVVEQLDSLVTRLERELGTPVIDSSKAPSAPPPSSRSGAAAGAARAPGRLVLRPARSCRYAGRPFPSAPFRTSSALPG